MNRLLFIAWLLFSTLSFAYAQEEPLWVEPGVSIGNVRLGTTLGQVIAQNGLANKIDEHQMFAELHYPLMTIEISYLSDMKGMLDEMKRGVKPDPSKWKAQVDWITTYDPAAKTRGRIGIGSTLKDVLDVFGDTQFRATSTDPLKLVKCGGIDAFKFPQNRPSSLRSDGSWPYVLSVDYDNEGISFYFKIYEKDKNLTVYAINVSERKDCKEIR